MKRDHDCRRPEPPIRAGPLDQFQDQHKQWIAEQEGEEKTFHAIKHPRLHRDGVESEPLFEFELRVPAERQFRNAQGDTNGEEKTGHGPDRCAEARAESCEHPWQQSAEKHCDQQQGVEHVDDIVKAPFGQRVISRTTICRLIEDSAKWRRQLFRVRLHMALVQPVQPQLGTCARKNQNESNDGEQRLGIHQSCAQVGVSSFIRQPADILQHESLVLSSCASIQFSAHRFSNQ